MCRQRTGTHWQLGFVSLAERDAATERDGRRPLIGGLLLVVALMALLSIASVMVLSSVRGYVGGESLYAKGQKEAVRALDRYIESRQPSDYARFQEALAVPLGDRAARIALDEPELDIARAIDGFVRGGNHVDDLRGMVRLYRWFNQVPFMADAIAIWAQADEEIVRLQTFGAGVHELALRAPIPDELRAQMHARLDDSNARLDALEQRFSQRLGEASRQVSGGLILAILALAGSMTLLASHFVARTLGRLTASKTALRESNTRWELAASAGGLGVFEWDVERDEFLLDARSLALCGWPGGSAVLSGAQLCSSMHPDDQRPIRDAALRARESGQTWIQRYRVIGTDDVVRHIEVSARMNPSGSERPDCMVGVIRDVTEALQADRLRTDKAAAERASQAKSEWLSRVSHELRTPLNAILGFARLMASDAQEPLSQAQRARLRHVLEGGDHLLGLVNEVLEISSLEQGVATLAIAPVPLQEVVDSTLHLLMPLADARGIAMIARAPQPALQLPSDRRRLEQVLLNLVSNAIKYNCPNGSVEVTLRDVDDGVAIEVRDSGIGMTAQQLAHLFEPFNRLGSERSDVEGAGLGLVLCRKLVELLGGTLHIDSRPREGTLARVWLPRVPPVAPAPSPARPPPAPQASLESPAPAGRVLYVEDNPVNVVLVEQLLARWPRVELVVAEDGSSGIEAARSHRPDLVLLDMQLPDLDGLQVLDALRADAHTADLPVLMVSASAMPEQVRAAMARGADGYLTKPIDLERFELEVRQWLGG